MYLNKKNFFDHTKNIAAAFYLRMGTFQKYLTPAPNLKKKTMWANKENSAAFYLRVGLF